MTEGYSSGCRSRSDGICEWPLEQAPPPCLLIGLAQEFAASCQNAGVLFAQFLLCFRTDADFRRLVVVEAGSCGDQVTQDHVFLQTDQVVDLARESGFGQHLGRFLEASSRDEAFARHGGLGDSQQLGAGLGGTWLAVLTRLAPIGFDRGVDFLDRCQRDHVRQPGIRCRLDR